MTRRRFAAAASAAFASACVAAAAVTPHASEQPRETRVPIGNASLYVREVGRGRPVIVLHGGPDFDHAYLLPELDQLADGFRLIYYDQRGRGRSAEKVRPEDVSLASDLDDLDALRRHLRLDTPVLLGHSWGAVIALEFALRHPTRVSQLVLMNPAPVSAAQVAGLRRSYAAQLGSEMNRQREILDSAPYKQGNPDAVAARYRIHFKRALHRPSDFEKLMARMSAGFRRQGREAILKAWAVEERLYRDTWSQPGYDLLPRLRTLQTPTLVIVGEQDFIPPAIAGEIAKALPNATLVSIPLCGHFAYLECASDVRRAFDSVVPRTP